MSLFTRQSILEKMRAKVAAGHPFRLMKLFLRDVAAAGADILIPHMGLTTKGLIGAETALTLEESARSVQTMHDAAKRVNREVLVLCHGGPIAGPADAQYILDHTEGIVGFYGASSMERLPVEPAISGRVREFTQLRFKRS
jgi:predicted TIM-barrel enzyme